MLAVIHDHDGVLGKMQLATTHAVACATKAVDLIHEAAGTSAIRNELSFQRYFRDVHTASQTAPASTQRCESAGGQAAGRSRLKDG